jgi:hypothetical protein
MNDISRRTSTIGNIQCFVQGLERTGPASTRATTDSAAIDIQGGLSLCSTIQHQKAAEQEETFSHTM